MLPRRPARRLLALLGLAALCVLLAVGSARAQDFELATGAPTFTTAHPVELGFVNVANGNLHMEIPLASPPQRGSLPYVAKLVYDSRIWQVVNNGTSSSWQPTNIPNSQGGWTFASTGVGGSITASETTSLCMMGSTRIPGVLRFANWTWTTPHGTPHVFPITTYVNQCTGTSTSGNAPAADSSGYYMTVTMSGTEGTVTVYAPNGKVVYPTSQGTDPNGNYYTLDPNGNVIDTLGRTPVVITPSCNGNSNQTCYDILNSQGTTSRVTVTTASIAVSTGFDESGVTEYSGNLTAIQSVQLPDGQSYQFSYDSGTTQGHYGELTGITLPTGGQISYGYTNFTDSYGNVNQWVTSHTSGGLPTAFQPAVATTCPPGTVGCEHTVTVTKPSGDYAVYTFTLNNGAWPTEVQYYNGPASGGTLLATTSTSWNFSIACTTDNCTGNQYIQKFDQTTTLPVSGGSINRTVQYSYDSAQDMNLSQISEYGFYTGSLPGSADRVTSITYLMDAAYADAHIINRPTSITVKDRGGAVLAQTNTQYDSTALVPITGVARHDDTNYGASYTTRGNPTVISRLTSGSTYATTTLAYDTTGQVVSVTDPNNNPIGLSYADNFYNDTGQPPASYAPPAPTNAYLTKVTLPIAGLLLFGYYWGTGKRALATDQNGASTYTHFLDSLDRLTNVYLPASGWTLTTYASETQADTYTGIGDASPSPGCSSCRHDETILDGLGRPIESVLVSDPEGGTRVDTGYDPTGRVESVTNPYRSPSDPTYGTEQFTYDGLDRMLSDQHADGSGVAGYYGASVTSAVGNGAQLCSTATYGIGYPILSVDEAGLKREVWIDGLGRTIEADEPDSSGSLTVGTCYLYDALGNLTQVVSFTGQTRSYAYDGLSRVTSVTTPEGGTVSYSYDADGNVVSRTAPKPNQPDPATHVTTSYTYDALNRLTSKSYSDGTTPGVSYSYDQTSYNGLSITNGVGRLTGMSDGSGQTAWSYDAAGRILAERRTIAGATEMISYGYNSDGTLKSITYPSGRTVAYTVGNAERPTAAVDGNGTNYAAGATYAPQGALASVVHGQVTGGFAGIAESYTYNNRLELASILANSSAGAALSLAYSFAQPAGNNGSVASITNNSDAGRTESLTYDPLDRVLTAQAQATSGSDCWGQSFGSGGLADDALGNLLSASVTKCTAPSLSVAVNGANQIAGFGYDAAGNMTADGQFTYTYDAENRITSSSAGVNYTYDGNDMRVEKSSGTLYWRAFSGNVLAETDTSGNTTKEYIYYGGRQIAWVDASGNVYYEFAEMLGSTRVVTDSSGNKCFDADYYPYGQELDAIPPSPTCSPTNRFTGYEYDAETGNYYAFFRYYSPRLGRFMTADPLGGSTGSPQSLNRYSYVANNPASFVDPLGLLHNLMPMPIGAGGGGGGGGGGGQFGSNWDEFDVLQAAFTPKVLDVRNGDYSYRVAVFENIGLLGWLFGAFDGPGNLYPNNAPAQPPQKPALSPKGQVCENKVQNAVNSALNTSTQFLGPELDNNSDASQPGLINGAYNFNYFAPGVNIQAPGVLPSCGRFDSGLHMIVPGVCNPSGDPFIQPWGYNAQLNGSFFTAHIDSADPYADVASFFIHLFRDVILKSQHGC
jgi:RHS repeat-associated protein